MKLVRDRIPQLKAPDGKVHHFGIAQDDATKEQLLRAKLIEECHEVASAETREDLILELADLQEATRAYMAMKNLAQCDVDTAAEKKLKDRGGFSCFYYLI